MEQYIAWLNGFSVARGTLLEVEQKAMEIIASPSYQEFGFRNGKTELKITKGSRQIYLKSTMIQKVNM